MAHMNTHADRKVELFTHFNEDIKDCTVPQSFTYPFHYDPHPLCELAAAELQDYISKQVDWEHNFGLDPNKKGIVIGKMLGVLVVKNSLGQIGYLSAISGKLIGKNDTSRFVPPINGVTAGDEYYDKSKLEVSKISVRLEEIESHPDFTILQTKVNELVERSKVEIEIHRSKMREAKKIRKLARTKAAQELSPEENKILLDRLAKESVENKFILRHLTEHWNNKIEMAKRESEQFLSEHNQLSTERKKIIAELQKKQIEQYQFLDIKGEKKGLADIFPGVAPAGSGDCAGPKLLQYAFENNLTPLAMSEFWWGAPPKSEVRTHTHVYPSCNSRCRPILGHMLSGMQVDPNPLLQNAGKDTSIEMIYQDEHIAVINKPSGLLSVPGKTIEDSVAHRLKLMFPNSTGQLVVHRLDQCTSGIMLIAKDIVSLKKLQQQFIKRTVHKKYLALLEREIESTSGTIELPLRVDLDNRPYQLVCYEHGRPAVTQYKVLNRNDGKTLIEFTPVTGRTHQLRVHSAHVDGLATPIIGDSLYGKKANRLHLHAAWIKFRHPDTNEEMTFDVPPSF